MRKFNAISVVTGGLLAVGLGCSSDLLTTSEDVERPLRPTFSIDIPSDGTCNDGFGWRTFSKAFGCGEVRIYDNTGLGGLSSGAISALIGEWNATGLPGAGLFDLVTTGTPADGFSLELHSTQDNPSGSYWCGNTNRGTKVITVWRNAGSGACVGATTSLAAILIHEFTHLVGSSQHITETSADVGITHCASAMVGPVSSKFCAMEIYGFAYVYGVSAWQPPAADLVDDLHLLTSLRPSIPNLVIAAGTDTIISLSYAFERANADDFEEPVEDGGVIFVTPDNDDTIAWGTTGSGFSLSSSSGTSVTVTAGGSAGSGTVWVRLDALDGDRYIVPPNVDSVAISVTVVQPTLSVSPDHHLVAAVPSGSAPGGSSSVTLSGPGARSANWSATKTASWATLTTSSGTGSGTVAWSRSTAGLSVGTYAGTITVTATGASGSPKVIYDTLVIADLPEPEDFELNGVCNEYPYGPKWYAEYGVRWTASGTLASTDSFRIYEGSGGSPWSTAGVIVAGRADDLSSTIGDWTSNTYLVGGPDDWRFFWLQFYRGGATSDTLRIVGDSLLVSEGCGPA